MKWLLRAWGPKYRQPGSETDSEEIQGVLPDRNEIGDWNKDQLMKDDPDRVRQYEHPKAAKHCDNVGRLQNGGCNQTGNSNGRQPEGERFGILSRCFSEQCREGSRSCDLLFLVYIMFRILQKHNVY